VGTTPEIGTRIADRYIVESVLGAGGMGIVLGVRDVESGEPRALKRLRLADDEGQPTTLADSPTEAEQQSKRLLREARAMMQLESPHIVRVTDCGLDADGPYLVMERLEGADLADLSPLDHQMPAQDVAAIAIQVCEALAHAHAVGIIHRDIKPSNLFRCGGSNGDLIKVLDFGISKLTTRAEWERTGSLTRSDALMGSPQFVSPEQLRDPRSVDVRTDIWSLGVVMYRLLAGQYPFGGSTLGELFVAVLEREPRPLDVPDEIAEIVSRCLRKDRNERYADVGELATALAPHVPKPWGELATSIRKRVGTKATVAPAKSLAPPPQKPSEKPSEPRTVRLSTVAAVGAIALGVVAVAFARSEPRPPAPVVSAGPVASPAQPAPSAIELAPPPSPSAAPAAAASSAPPSPVKTSVAVARPPAKPVASTSSAPSAPLAPQPSPAPAPAIASSAPGLHDNPYGR
jgi:eukaryotic-like serine/threonine-protein kinase